MPLLWVHEDCLSPEAPHLREYPGAPAVFVWDEQMLRAERWGLKRIGFVYECLLEMPVEIERGDPVEVLAERAARAGAGRVVTVRTVDPRLRLAAARLAERVKLDLVDPEPFVRLRRQPDLKRFSRYWRSVEPVLTGGGR